MNRLPRFFWQGVLIVLPVLLLAAVGVVSLWKDRATVTLGARQAAEEFGGRLTEFLSAELLGELQAVSERMAEEPVSGNSRIWSDGNRIGPEGNLLNVGTDGAPGEFSRFPAGTRFSLEQLDEEARNLWSRARSAELRDPREAFEAYERFVATGPPEPFRANAEFARAVLLVGVGEHEAADEILRSLRETAEVTEAGLPLAALVAFQRVKLLATELRVGNSGTEEGLRLAVDELCTVVRERASLATDGILRATEELVEGLDDEAMDRVRVARSRWIIDENTREFFGTVKARIGTAGAFWAEWGDAFWFVMLNAAEENGGGFSMRVFPEAAVREAVENLVRRGTAGVPDYLEAVVFLGGRLVSEAEAGGEPLVVVSGELAGGGALVGDLRVELHLADPDLLYAQQRQRAFWFGGLIVLAAGTALTGFVGARRAFQRQLDLNEMKSNFVASVSHELRAPIASVRLLAEGLERGSVSEPERQREYFRFIVQECRRLSSLIENVLDFARIEQGRREYDFGPTDIVALAEHATDLMRPTALERKVGLEFQVDLEVASRYPQAELDGKAIQQALVNLIDNAIKHSPPNSTVNVRVGSRQGGGVLLSVEDRGEGISPDEHERIFERFYRAGSELRRETQGAGIGLSIVKHIVEGHGGRVSLRSKIGEGSCFTIEIPV